MIHSKKRRIFGGHGCKKILQSLFYIKELWENIILVGKWLEFQKMNSKRTYLQQNFAFVFKICPKTAQKVPF